MDVQRKSIISDRCENSPYRTVGMEKEANGIRAIAMKVIVAYEILVSIRLGYQWFTVELIPA